MTDNEIFARIADDVAEVANCMFGIRDVTIWMTKDLFNRLFPEQFIAHKDTAMVTLFGCNLKVVIFPYAGEQWIVGYEGMIE